MKPTDRDGAPLASVDAEDAWAEAGQITCDSCGQPVASFVLHTDQQGLARPGPQDFELRPCGHRSTVTYPPAGSLPGVAVRDRP